MAFMRRVHGLYEHLFRPSRPCINTNEYFCWAEVGRLLSGVVRVQRLRV